MNSKHIILLGGFLFAFSLLSAQQIPKGISLGVPSFVRIPVGDVYYNTISSGVKWWEDVLQTAPGISISYHTTTKHNFQAFIKQTNYAAGYWRVYSRAKKAWDFPEFFFRLGAGVTYYLPFAPSCQLQWEVGVFRARMWRNVGLYRDEPDAYIQWRPTLPYSSLSVQTTALGKRLVIGAGLDVMVHDDYASLVDEMMFMTYVGWSLKARENK
ncbi:MAG: hypothetical protein AAF927_29250 [Bacteroidota bacterium]